jgi:hypothetical protein
VVRPYSAALAAIAPKRAFAGWPHPRHSIAGGNRLPFIPHRTGDEKGQSGGGTIYASLQLAE